MILNESCEMFYKERLLRKQTLQVKCTEHDYDDLNIAELESKGECLEPLIDVVATTTPILFALM